MHMQFYLSANGFEQVGDLLKEAIVNKGLVPKRYNVNGVPCSQTYDEFVSFIL